MFFVVWTAWALAGVPSVVVDDAAVAVVADGGDEAVAEALADLEAGRWRTAARQLEALADAGGAPELRWLAAVARYEEGDLIATARLLDGAGRGRRVDPRVGVLRALVLTDRGAGEEAATVLADVQARLRAAPDPWAEAQVARIEALIADDAGDPEAAARALQRCETVASAAGLGRVVQSVTAQKRAWEAARATDRVGLVSDAVRRGDFDAARSLASAPTSTRRDEIRQAVALGIVARADGHIAASIEQLDAAIAAADAAGLVREAVAARLERGHVDLLLSDADAASQVLGVALRAVAGTSLVVREVDLRAALVRVAVLREDLGSAQEHLAAAESLARTVTHPLLGPRLLELRGLVAGLAGDLAASSKWLGEATEAWLAAGYGGDAARAATAWVQIAAQRDEGTPTVTKRALVAFQAAGRADGPAHVALAEGLGLVAAGHVDRALLAFASAREAAASSGATDVERVARDNIAEAMRVLGLDAEAVAPADAATVTAARAEGLDAYRQGREAFERRRYAEARERFGAAVDAFETAGDADRSKQALGAWGWATWNDALTLEATVARARHAEALDAAERVGDADLALRASTSEALLAVRLDRPGALARVETAARAAERAGERVLAARCWAERSAHGGDFDARVRAAHAAAGLDAGPVGTDALTDLAFAAYRADRLELTVTLAGEVLAVAPERADVQQLLEAARAAIGAP